MEPRLTVLKLFLEGLDTPVRQETLSDRKRIQYTIYLGQSLGQIDLGYRFGWFGKMGPYCPRLSTDMAELISEIEISA
jgi:uncharacterized protein YwgA